MTKEEAIRSNSFREEYRKRYPDKYREGKNSIAFCHDDTNPSFSIYADHGYCNACQKRVDIFALQMEETGCTYGEALKHYGVTDGNGSAPKVSSTGPTKPSKKPQAKAPKPQTEPLGAVVCEYIYKNEDGEPLFKVIRHDPKTFRQWRFDGKLWKAGLDVKHKDGAVTETRRVLYNLQEVMRNQTVWICEGEKDCDNLWALFPELAVTCSCGGAQGWQTQVEKWRIHEPLCGKHIVIFPDCDKAGDEYIKSIVKSLLGKAKSLKVVRLPGMIRETK